MNDGRKCSETQGASDEVALWIAVAVSFLALALTVLL